MMEWKQVDNRPRTFVLIFDRGDEIATGLNEFAANNNLAAASFKAIGAVSAVKLAWFDPEARTYRTSVDVHEQLELLSMIGDVFEHEGKPMVHAHVVVGRADGSTAGGHLVEAHVRPTCEVILTESPVHLSKFLDSDSGLALVKL